MCDCVQVREYVRDVVEAAVDTARRTVDAREMAAMPRLACLLYNLSALLSPRNKYIFTEKPILQLKSKLRNAWGQQKRRFYIGNMFLNNHNILAVVIPSKVQPSMSNEENAPHSFKHSIHSLQHRSYLVQSRTRHLAQA